MAADKYKDFPTGQLRERLADYGQLARRVPDTEEIAHEEINLMLDELERRGEVKPPCPPS